MKRHDDLQLDASSNQAREWITGQFSLQRDLLIVLDPLAEPDPVVALFGAGLAQDHLNLYLGTEFADLAPVAPGWHVCPMASRTSSTTCWPILSATGAGWPASSASTGSCSPSTGGNVC